MTSGRPITVRAANVGKCFRRVHERPMLLREAFMLATRRKRVVDDLWAVRNVSFDLRAGETFGILGANGSGKSTLLSLLGGTSFPTEGTVSTRGRIATWLALGAGFHPDMTGEENILASAGLMGIPIAEARRRMPDIIAFAELGSAIDTPIRHYSSGMSARLGFAIAVHVEPDILVADEVLAVGDLAFQEKCLKEVLRLRNAGATIVLASQAPMVVAEFATRALWLASGQVKMMGGGRDVASAYTIHMTGRTLEESLSPAGVFG
jgi:ABC-2 type transport system ATP-binding protein